MNEVANYGDRRMTVREVAETFGCNPETIKGHIRELFPDLMKNGVTTYLSEAQATIILERIKKTSAEHRGIESINLQRSVAGVETALTPTLKLEMLYRQIDEIKTAEIKRLKDEKQSLQIQLSEAREWYSVKRVLIETGKSYPWKPLKEYSVANGYEVQQVFDQNYEHVNAYHIDVWNKVYGLEL